jgi:cation:H+ antiporter
MTDLSSFSLSTNIIVFFCAAGAIGSVGTKMASLADRLADRTGFGEAITGMIFLGITTSLAGISASVTAALEGHAALAISNAMGGIAVQTAFLAIADIAYKKANLEHAAASVTCMIQAALLLALLALALFALTGPEIAVAHIHPVTFVLFLSWGGGLWLVYRSRTEPMWRPKQTEETVEDIPEESLQKEHLGKLLSGFVATAVVVIAAGAVVAHTVANIAAVTGLHEVMAGALLSAIATSLPELATTVAAVRRGALTLAVSDIVGGNSFDVLFVCAADVVYVQGSLYHGEGVGGREVFLTALTIMLNAILLLGLLYRQRVGPANIGFESVLMLLLYVGGFAILSMCM